MYNITSKLSPKNKIILDQMLKGKTNKEIGNSLNLTESTIKSYVSDIYTKLHIKNRKEVYLLHYSEILDKINYPKLKSILLAQRFSPAEIKVIFTLIKGLSNNQVSTQLGLTPKTVKFHKTNIYRKAKVSNLTSFIYKMYSEIIVNPKENVLN